ncbi:Stk1 family PASTA domain-containing Ser/Thr kinase [Glaciihabitans sp. INWT7]|uniref:Stk1 family PASTA domain-containing Ser/Thr kinase n=1 Tax=Glaciihabitans sp. INWT7 TaxID=2596912 RepID=UPI0016291351|nr:Stk1 family PASTA domain-containing Ser/Thr kinase [Glaciihabitans sp. INWT7]QNE46616.1 Stk1 family PASTA domain-containing Ser/Thr kinase [Glaciihabitans sp. INWT7]
MTTSSTDPLIGRLIDGRYQVRSRIARGGMATVYLATDLRLERRVAIKVMHGHLADDSQYRARFIQEARSAARLAHPNVVNVYDQGQDGETAYLVMEYLPGITLRDLLMEHKVLTTMQAMDIMEAILSGLAAAHKNGIVHRDLKPENVLLADDGRIKIGDFGLARAASANTATGNALLGTIAYLSPELVTRGVADARSDIYAVGIMLYEMLAGEQPFRGEQAFQIAHQHANDTVPTPSTKNPRVPAELDELVLWATARDPEQRPRDAKAMLDQLHETEALLRLEEPTAATAIQRTMIMPSAVAAPSSTGDTQILSPKARHRTGPILTETANTLALKSDRRRRKGFWLFALVILFAALAGGTGWYFGTGPGAQVAIPDLAGQSPAAATTTLTGLGLTVNPTPGETPSLKVPKGAVAQTTPAIGTRVPKDSQVTLLVSSGPKNIAVPTLVGEAQNAAIQNIKDAGFRYDSKASSKQFDAKVSKDTVISAFGTDALDLTTVTTYGQNQPISLVVSVGAIPDVAGKSVADATNILTAVKLTATPGRQEYSDTVPSGSVIGIDVANGAVIRPGDPISLTISKGKEQIAVPDVINMTWAKAKQTLLDAGFKPSYNRAADAVAFVVTVGKTDPAAGTMVDKGSTVKVNFNSF